MNYKDNDISDWIPEYCNNRLDANEKAEFESLLQEDPELLAECNDFQEFQKLYRQIDSAEPSPSDAIFNQISSNINVQQKVERKASVQSSKLIETIRSYWEQIHEFVSVPWMLAAAQAAVIVLLLMPATDQTTQTQNTYATLSGSEMAVYVEKSDINVVFQPTAVESDIRSLLHTIQGSVSSGPSSEGRYVVSISIKSDLDTAIQTLKESEIVLFADLVR